MTIDKFVKSGETVFGGLSLDEFVSLLHELESSPFSVDAFRKLHWAGMEILGKDTASVEHPSGSPTAPKFVFYTETAGRIELRYEKGFLSDKLSISGKEMHLALTRKRLMWRTMRAASGNSNPVKIAVNGIERAICGLLRYQPLSVTANSFRIYDYRTTSLSESSTVCIKTVMFNEKIIIPEIPYSHHFR